MDRLLEALPDSGLHRYVRGRLGITDRAELEAVSCDCYRVIAEQFARLVGGDG